MVGYETDNRLARVCAGQEETGEADAMFVLQDGATLSNVRVKQCREKVLKKTNHVLGHHRPQPS